MAFSSFALFKTLSSILQCHQKVPLDNAIRHAPKIPHTNLWPVLVHILECPHELGKEGSCKKTKQLTIAPVFGLYFVMYGIENKMALYTFVFSQFFNEYFCFSLSSAPHLSSTLAFPSSISYIILPWLPAALNEEHFKGTDRGLV
jgi:hypothetical protein